jgi:hypothetical protein
MLSVNDAEVKQIVLWEYPNNYAMQEYTYDMQLSAKRYMGNATEREVKTIALGEYPNDYSVQKHTLTCNSRKAVHERADQFCR